MDSEYGRSDAGGIPFEHVGRVLPERNAGGQIDRLFPQCSIPDTHYMENW